MKKTLVPTILISMELGHQLARDDVLQCSQRVADSRQFSRGKRHLNRFIAIVVGNGNGAVTADRHFRPAIERNPAVYRHVIQDKQRGLLSIGHLDILEGHVSFEPDWFVLRIPLRTAVVVCVEARRASAARRCFPVNPGCADDNRRK